jgi:hypothetical protein
MAMKVKPGSKRDIFIINKTDKDANTINIALPYGESNDNYTRMQ